MKIVLDTNIIISFMISTDGNPARIFEIIINGELINYITEEIIDEIKNVIKRPKIKKLISLKKSNRILEILLECSILINPKINFKVIKEDPDDDKFIDCAIAAKANIIISGDNHLLKLQKFKEIIIINPNDFLMNMNKKN